MKKLVSVFLALVLLFGCSSAFALAAEDEKVTPVILTTGYGTPFLFENYGTDEQRMAWPFSPLDAVEYTLGDLPYVVPATLKAILGDTADLGSGIAKGGCAILPYMYCNPDGTSVGNISHLPNEPETTNYDYLLKKNLYIGVYEYALSAHMAKERGGENVFIFQYDYRMGAVDITNELNEYVNRVLEYTGAEKVDMFGLSYGGFLTGVYLSRFGTKGVVNNAVLSVPALAGSTFAKDFFMGEADLPVDELITYLELAIGTETAIGKAIEKPSYDKINALVGAFLADAHEIACYWGSMWDLMRPDDYEKLKAEYLDPVESARLIENSDYIHNDIMKNYTKNFTACQKKGVKISIICNTGTDTCFGDTVNADMLIDVASVSGAKTAPKGQRFPDGYQPCNKVCKNGSHYHVSPSMEIDASSAYLPENTWFIDGQYHGMYSLEDYSMALVRKLLSADEKVDIYSDPAYPQFKASCLPYYGVYAQFNNSSSGYVDGNDTELVVTNVSDKYPVQLSSITCDGMDLSFDLSSCKVLKPGESVSLPFTGTVPNESAVRAAVNITFLRVGSITNAYGTRTLDFTLRNGSAPEHEGGYVSTDFEKEELSLKDKLSELLNMFTAFIKNLFSLQGKEDKNAAA